ncbi:MAG TPA: methionine--tRNA ligase [Candidatus Baltobacteraceae bacterium]|jgi:methionyl-tRNA synthetase|nr:methionine--tRNA ligase [Candidatus Baltobacteraceae bacterium]
MSRLYLTTPIYYVNADPHTGHAHTGIMADILKRAAQMRGVDVFLSTGTDEHGQKAQESAEQSGLPVDEYIERQSDRFRALYDSIDVSYDKFVRTADPHHVEGVRVFEQMLFDRGLLVKKEYHGIYCSGCELFKKISDLNESGRCDDHPSLVPEAVDEMNYFLPLEPFRPWLLEWIETHPLWVQPERYRNELLQMLQTPLEDLCISRPKTRVQLGVELPFDQDYITYVWVDALANYVTNVGWPDPKYTHWWNHAVHLGGKDMLKTHCVYWPIMLKSIGLEPPSGVQLHGFWLGAGGLKMSKTLGNVVDPNEVVGMLGADALRFFLAKNMRSTSDTQIALPLIVQTYNADLANKLGNTLSRLTKFADRNFDGRIPAPNEINSADRDIFDDVCERASRSHASLTLESIPALVAEALSALEALNGHLDRIGPWKIIKEDGGIERAASVLYASLDATRLLFEMLYPVIPVAANKGLECLGLAPIPSVPQRHEFATERLKPGSRLGNSITLFPRIQTDLDVSTGLGEASPASERIGGKLRQ